MRGYFDLKNEFSSMVEKARIELKGDCPLIEDAAILAASERIAELEKELAKTKQSQKSGWLRDSNTHVNKSKEQGK